MKLVEPLSLTLQYRPGQYHRAFRCIGQDIAHLLPSNFIIEIQGESFTVKGTCSRTRLVSETQPSEKPEKQSLLGKFFGGANKAPAPQVSPSDTTHFERSYAIEDIDRLDEAGIKRRTGMNRILDARSVAEILRTVGRLLDNGNFRLTSLSKHPNGVTVVYRDSESQSHEEELTMKDLVNLHESYFKTRGKFKPFDLWRHAD